MGIRSNALSWWILSLLSVAGLAAPASDLRLAEAVKNKDRDAVRSLLNQGVEEVIFWLRGKETSVRMASSNAPGGFRCGGQFFIRNARQKTA